MRLVCTFWPGWRTYVPWTTFDRQFGVAGFAGCRGLSGAFVTGFAFAVPPCSGSVTDGVCCGTAGAGRARVCRFGSGEVLGLESGSEPAAGESDGDPQGLDESGVVTGFGATGSAG
jgi:hypothetical protein